nr:probable 26S proteasome non-ATPase regulatory subunit 3 [Ipomoea batatas]
MKDIASLIETGAYAREVRRIARAVRLTMALRKKLKASTLNAFLNFILSPGSEVHSRLSSYLPKAKACSSASIVRLKTLNRRTVDVLASRLYYYYSLSYELTGDLAEIRGQVPFPFAVQITSS